jgi:hypothetical protein
MLDFLFGKRRKRSYSPKRRTRRRSVSTRRRSVSTRGRSMTTRRRSMSTRGRSMSNYQPKSSRRSRRRSRKWSKSKINIAKQIFLSTPTGAKRKTVSVSEPEPEAPEFTLDDDVFSETPSPPASVASSGNSEQDLSGFNQSGSVSSGSELALAKSEFGYYPRRRAPSRAYRYIRKYTRPRHRYNVPSSSCNKLKRGDCKKPGCTYTKGRGCRRSAGTKPKSFGFGRRRRGGPTARHPNRIARRRAPSRAYRYIKKYTRPRHRYNVPSSSCNKLKRGDCKKPGCTYTKGRGCRRSAGTKPKSVGFGRRRRGGPTARHPNRIARHHRRTMRRGPVRRRYTRRRGPVRRRYTRRRGPVRRRYTRRRGPVRRRYTRRRSMRNYNVKDSPCNNLEQMSCKSNPNCSYTRRGCRRRAGTIKKGTVYEGPSLPPVAAKFGRHGRKSHRRKSTKRRSTRRKSTKRRSTRRKSTKRHSKISAKILAMCRRHRVKTTVKRGGKRVHKSLKMIMQQLKKKMKTHRRR